MNTKNISITNMGERIYNIRNMGERIYNITNIDERIYNVKRYNLLDYYKFFGMRSFVSSDVLKTTAWFFADVNGAYRNYLIHTSRYYNVFRSP